MKRFFYLNIVLFAVTALITTTALAAPAPAPANQELGQLKVCKVAGAGVPEGKLFTIKVDGNSYRVPAGPGSGGFCVLAGLHPVGSNVTVRETIPSGYYVARIEARPDRIESKDVTQGTAIVKIGAGVTEVIFTNRSVGSPTPTKEPTPLVTSTQRPTRTPTATPDCAPNCTPTSTPIPRGRLQICKEADGQGVQGYFTFKVAGKTVTVPAGACSGLIGVDAGSLVVTEDAQPGYAVTDIYTIPADRLLSQRPGDRTATVKIVEGYAASQTIVVFRNRALSVTATPSPTGTLTTRTSTPTSGVCQPEVVRPDFTSVPVGTSVEGLGVVDPRLNIDGKRTAVHLQEGMNPAVYASNVNGVPVFNAGMAASGGFSDPETKNLLEPHLYTFTFAPGVAISNFKLQMLDFGDFNPTGSSTHLVTLAGFNASNVAVVSQQLSYTSVGGISPQYGNLAISGDAITALPQQPGNWTWDISGTGIVRVVLEFGAGHDPNFGLDLISFTIDCGGAPIPATPTHTPTVPACQPTVVMPDISQIPVGNSVEGLGAVHPDLNIDARGTAVHILEGADPAVYASIVNGNPVMNAGMVAAGGFSDPPTKDVLQAHLYTFTFAPGVAITNFSLHMLDFGDFNPTGSGSHMVTLTGFNASNVAVASQQLSYTSSGGISPQYGNLSVTGDAITALPGQPGNWTWNISGSGIVRVVLEFGVGYDPNLGFDLLSFTKCSPGAAAPTPTP